jgi:hypothetical protein
MKTFKLRIIFISALIFILCPNFSYAEYEDELLGVSPSRAAELIHKVIEAGRRTYSKKIVEHLHNTTFIKASENWEKEDALPLPAQFLSMSSKISNSRGIGMKYRLLSLWPINKNNLPRSENEKVGLEEIIKKPDKSFSWVIPRDGHWYYETIFPDIAISKTCISCHNNHTQSPKTDFEIDDVMGGIFIDFPLGRRTPKSAHKKFLLAPEVVADYVHSILEANRTIYARHIVNRLEKRKVVPSIENWQGQKAIMLPAQFLLNTANIINKKKIGLKFKLISLFPINPDNSPVNEFERRGLETGEVHPIRPYSSYTRVGRKKAFKAIYPDRAVTKGCVNCHNNHPNSPKNNFKLDDIMGGIFVKFFLD